MGILIVILLVSLPIDYVFFDQGLANPWLYATAQIPICPGHEMSVFTAKKAPCGPRNDIAIYREPRILGNRKTGQKMSGGNLIFYSSLVNGLQLLASRISLHS